MEKHNIAGLLLIQVVLTALLLWQQFKIKDEIIWLRGQTIENITRLKGSVDDFRWQVAHGQGLN